jgi:integrase/recombinase XerD
VVVTVRHACAEFLKDATARGLREPTLYKYRLPFKQLQEFADRAGLDALTQLDLEAVRNFPATWPNRNIADRKKLEATKAFFRFCWESGWISHNPASKLKAPRTMEPPTMPFTREEIDRTLAACDNCGAKRRKIGRRDARRLRALVLLLRFTGLRIRDAVTLRREHLTNGKLLLFTAKIGTPVYCPLPGFLVTELEMAQSSSLQHFFWSGEAKPKSCVGDWQRSLRKLFRLADVTNGHAHRFRHTFAVELLLAGVPLDRVATLLGHTNSKITERHCAPWIRARQDQLEAEERNPPHTFIARCKLCEYENVFSVANVQAFDGLPRRRIVKARAAGSAA